VPVADLSLCAQVRTLPLCIIQTKLDKATQYDPSAGSWAISLYNQLSGKKLRNGSLLKITVFPASVEKDVLPEVRRLQCTRVVQIWFDSNSIQQGAVSGVTPHGGGLVMAQEPRYEESLYYSLWDTATQKVLVRGQFPLAWHSETGEALNKCAGVALAEQTLKWLNRTR
jgi:hypothetical protein